MLFPVQKPPCGRRNAFTGRDRVPDTFKQEECMTVPKRFDILRFFSSLMKVLAWLNLVLAILGAIGVALGGAQVGQLLQSSGDAFGQAGSTLGGIGGIVIAVLILLGGLFYFVVFYAMGELIALMVAMEENTRLSAALLLKMHQESQVDTRTAYPGAFASEPAPFK
jgi:hypothetical protein